MKFPKGVTRCRRPLMREHRGRTWDSAELTLPDGRIILAYLDTTWGTRFYFELDFIWRSAPIDDFKHEVCRRLYFDMLPEAHA